MISQSASLRSAPEPGRDSVDLHVGQRLKARRILANMSQERLATALGISYQQLQRYESGKGRLPSAMLYRAAMALGVPIGHFFEQLDEGAPAAAALPMDKPTLTILRKLQDIANPNTRECLTRLIEELGKTAPKAKSARR
jgi:transcriptional regulator with XRE-family HTH domain